MEKKISIIYIKNLEIFQQSPKHLTYKKIVLLRFAEIFCASLKAYSCKILIYVQNSHKERKTTLENYPTPSFYSYSKFIVTKMTVYKSLCLN